MPKIYQYTFGGWAPPGPAGGANVLPQALLLKQGRRGEGRNAEGRGNVDPQSPKTSYAPGHNKQSPSDSLHLKVNLK